MPRTPLRPHAAAPAPWLVAAVAAVQAWLLWSLHRPDMTADPLLGPFGWIDPLSAVKLLQAASLLALALAMRRLLGVLGAQQRTQWAAVVFALPPAAFNALTTGQSDALHAAACVMAVAMALERRHFAMFAWCGAAVAAGAQALLAAPFFIALAIQRRLSLRCWLAVPAALLAIVLPALLAGWPPADLVAIHFRQAGMFSGAIAHHSPNLWSLAAAISPAHAPQLLGLAVAAALGATAAYVARIQTVRFDRAGLVGMAALAGLLTAGLLPGMDERHFLLAGILLLAFAIARGTRRAFTLAALAQLGSSAAILGSLGLGMPAVAIGALAMIAATWLAAQPLIAPHANDNRDGPHAIPFPHGLRGTLGFDMLPAVSAPHRGAAGE